MGNTSNIEAEKIVPILEYGAVDSRAKFSKISPENYGITKKSSPNSSTFNYMSWYDGSANNEPASILNVILSNSMAATILETKAKFIIGDGLVLFKEVVENGKVRREVIEDKEITGFFERTDLNEMLSRAAKDLMFFGNCFFEQISNFEGDVIDINHVDATTVRAQEAGKDGYIGGYFICGDWTNASYDKAGKTGNTQFRKAVKPIAQYADTNTMRDALVGNSLIHIKEYTPGFPYYSLPSWYGTSKWLELSNLIAPWHIQGIKNGYGIRFLIEVDDSFFAQYSDEKEKKKAKRKLQDDLDKALTGVDNVGKTIFVNMPHSAYIEKGIIRITAIPNSINDAAFTTIFTSANTATTSGFGFDPTLAGIETQGKLSSGSEKRIAYDLWLKLHAPRLRKLMLDALIPTIKIMNWDARIPGLKLGFKNTELTTIDVNPTGQQNVI